MSDNFITLAVYEADSFEPGEIFLAEDMRAYLILDGGSLYVGVVEPDGVLVREGLPKVLGQEETTALGWGYPLEGEYSLYFVSRGLL